MASNTIILKKARECKSLSGHSWSQVLRVSSDFSHFILFFLWHFISFRLLRGTLCGPLTFRGGITAQE